MSQMPVQKPGRSKQNYRTPPEFLLAVEKRFGKIAIDLACGYDPDLGYSNTVAARFFDERDGDSLKQDWWVEDHETALMWLNPPYADITPWARKCSVEVNRGCEILFLVPASVGANWFWDYVAPYADVYCLQPRLSFDGKHPYPKDLILAHYWKRNSSDTYITNWRWKP